MSDSTPPTRSHLRCVVKTHPCDPEAMEVVRSLGREPHDHYQTVTYTSTGLEPTLYSALAAEIERFLAAVRVKYPTVTTIKIDLRDETEEDSDT